MDRSVDSIGSCSLDVDADSTDFSDTSGELNFLTPISGKDITREFTAGIKERCMLPVINCQAVTSVLDPVTGHISTVLTTTATSQHPASCASTQPLLGTTLGGGDTSPGSGPAAPNSKKPSYLNLACCVNGYSNLTTYDSKLRQDINKSREVSPSRPIIATLHYNRTESGPGGGGTHLLTAPTLSYVSMNNTINNNYSSGTTTAGANRMFKNGATNGTGGGRMRTTMNHPADVTDNAAANGFFNGNGSFLGGGLTTMRTSKVISSQSQISSLSRDDPSCASQLLAATPKKSFIQQRVEKLYGATEGVVINKQYYSSSERKYLNNIANENHGPNGTTTGATVGPHGKSGQLLNGNGNVGMASVAKNGVGNGHHHHLNHHHAHLLHHHHQNSPYSGNEWGSLISTAVDENNRQINGEDQEGAADPEMDALPVLRHLRPEFRAQLQIFSPKKVPKVSPNRTAESSVNGNNNLSHATANGTEENSSISSIADQQLHSLPANGNHRHTVEEREEQTHSNRSTVSTKSARISTNGTSTRSNGQYYDEEVLTSEENSITRHHSNASSSSSSTRTVTTVHSYVTEQPAASATVASSTAAGSYSGSVPAAEEALVEEKMRSLVVVAPPASAAETCVSGLGRGANGDDGGIGTDESIAAAIAAVTSDDSDVSEPPATSVIENGERNGALENRETAGDSDGLDIVVHVHCDSSGESTEQQQQAVPNSMLRTVNGGETASTMVLAVAPVPSSVPVMPMADIELPRQVVDAEVAGRRDKSAVEVLAPAAPSVIDAVVTNGTSNSSSSSSNSGKNGSSSSGSNNASNNNNNNNNDVLDGNYFLQILKTEQRRLGAMADEVEKEISQLKGNGVDIGEDLNGYVLVAVGKARLLCSQKMKQFEDLCYTNLNQSPDEKFQTTGEDLRGFWDMVMLQVNNVDATFVEIDSFRKNGWRKPIPKSPAQARNGGAAAPRTTKLVKRPYKTPAQNGGAGSTVTDGSNGGAAEAKKASAALAAAKREAQRKQLMEMKRKQKLLANSQPQPVEIFAPSGEDGSVALNGGGDAPRRTTTPAVDTS